MRTDVLSPGEGGNSEDLNLTFTFFLDPPTLFDRPSWPFCLPTVSNCLSCLWSVGAVLCFAFFFPPPVVALPTLRADVCGQRSVQTLYSFHHHIRDSRPAAWLLPTGGEPHGRRCHTCVQSRSPATVFMSGEVMIEEDVGGGVWIRIVLDGCSVTWIYIT